MGVALSCLLRVEFDCHIFRSVCSKVNFSADMGNFIAGSVLQMDTTRSELSLT